MDEPENEVDETIRSGVRNLVCVIDYFCANGANKTIALGRLKQAMDAAILAAHEQEKKSSQACLTSRP